MATQDGPVEGPVDGPVNGNSKYTLTWTFTSLVGIFATSIQSSICSLQIGHPSNLYFLGPLLSLFALLFDIVSWRHFPIQCLVPWAFMKTLIITQQPKPCLIVHR